MSESVEDAQVESDSDQLSIKEKVCYGLGDISNGLAVSSVGLWFLIYLTDVAGLRPSYAGLAIVIGRVWDAVTDPLMGWITDHTKSRWGKRRPYLIFGAIPYALAFFSLWVVPDFDEQVYIFAYVTIALIIFNTCLTVVFVPYTSLTAAITNDYNERTSLTGYRMTSSQIAMLIGATVPSAIVLWSVSKDAVLLLESYGIHELFGSWAGTARSGYFIVATIFAMIIIASVWTTAFGTRERDAEDDNDGAKVTPLGYASSILKQLKSNHPFRISVLILLLTNSATTFVAVNLPYYLDYALGMKSQQTQIIGLLFVVATASVPAWALITKKYGKTETYQIAMTLYIITLCMLPLVGRGETGFAYLIASLAGVFQGAALMIPWAIVPDVVEYDELKTGKRREGLFYGGTTFSYKMATAIAVFVSSYILEFVGYVPNADQTDTVITGIKWLIGPLPACFLAISAVLSLRYPLTSEKHHLIVEELKQRKAEQKQKSAD